MKPAIFNTEMVRAILDDRKTNTRRLDKNFPDSDMCQLFNCGTSKDGFLYAHFSNGKAVKAPYKVGDIIYVRETFTTGYSLPWGRWIYYKSSFNGEVKNPIWKPSIHMPKEYARLFLRVKDVRIERLNEIGEEDALAEGIRKLTKDGMVYKYCVFDHKDYSSTPWTDMARTAKKAFENLWESIYGKDSFDNRYVWVIEFERISKDEAYRE